MFYKNGFCKFMQIVAIMRFVLEKAAGDLEEFAAILKNSSFWRIFSIFLASWMLWC